jgi:phosphoglycolate phosphatase-like HAD superfamily hydrolase
MKTAANGGIAAIAVTWGYRDLPAEVAPIRATTAAELTSLLL